ncbi:dTDP-4-amino-4,6-dideoxygalactose transaminase [compost metagenome]
MEEAQAITDRRLAIWDKYHAALAGLETRGALRRPIVPQECRHNAHMYHVLLNSLETRTRLIAAMRAQDIHPVFHYVPLHSSPAGRKYARCHGELPVTDLVADRLLRLPLWTGIESEQDRVIEVLHEALDSL